LLIAFVIAIGDRVLMAYKWNILLKAKAISISLKDVTFTYLTSTFLGLFLPATVGGDALRAYALSKSEHDTSDIISSIIVERLLGFIALFVFVLLSILVGLFVLERKFHGAIGDLFWFSLGALAILSLLIYFSLSRFLSQRLVLLFGRLITTHKYRLFKKLENVYDSYRNYNVSKPYLVAFFLLSFVENIFPILWTYFVSLAFNIEVSILYLFILVPIVMVLVRLPISFDGIGIQEGAFVYFLSMVGVAKSEALFLGIASHIIAILSVLPGGLLYCLNGLSLYSGAKIEKNKLIEMPTDPD
jgi:hypothetical protein